MFPRGPPAKTRRGEGLQSIKAPKTATLAVPRRVKWSEFTDVPGRHASQNNELRHRGDSAREWDDPPVPIAREDTSQYCDYREANMTGSL